MKDDNMILSSMNQTVSYEQPGLFSKWIDTAHTASIQEQKDVHASPDSSVCLQPNKKEKSTTVRRRWSFTKQREQEPEQTGKGLSDMAEAQANLGHYDKAYQLWNQALQLQKEKLGSRHPTVACTLTRRASASAHLGRWYPAALDLETAARIYQSNGDDVLASDTLIELSMAQERMGHLEEAVANMETALALKEKLQDQETVARLNILIGNIRHQQRDYKRALRSYKIGIERYERAGVGKSHPDVVWAARRASDRSIQGHLFWNQASRRNSSDDDSSK